MQRRFAITVWLISTVLLMVGILEVEAQAARVSVAVVDPEGAPIEGATLNITCDERGDLSETEISNKKGRISVIHIDSQRTYRYEIVKDGYQTHVRQVRPDYAKTTRLEIVLLPLAPANATGGKGTAAKGGGRALEAFNEGAEAQERGDLELAEKKFRLAAELSPNAAEPHVALAVVAHQRGDFAAAAAEAEKALAISPNNNQALLLQYDAYRLLGDAEKEAEAAAALREHGDVSVAAGAAFTEGMTEYRAGNIDTAKEKFAEAVDLDPTMVNAALMLGNIALQEGDTDRAAAVIAKVLEVDPGNSNALMINYDIARASGDSGATRAALDALIEADPEWAANDLFNHAVELFNNDEMEGAASALAKVVEANPEDARARYLLGMASYNLGDMETARQQLEAFLELAPNDPDAALAREMLKYAQ